MIYLVRHAHAGSKRAWTGPDHLRPLSSKGRAQVRCLVADLRPYPISAVVSSPAVRCRQTVEGLAAERGVPIVVEERLTADAEARSALDLVVDPNARGSVLCTHGELIGRILGALRELGTPLGEDAPCAKGSVWLLETDAGQVTQARYVRPRVPA